MSVCPTIIANISRIFCITLLYRLGRLNLHNSLKKDFVFKFYNVK